MKQTIVFEKNGIEYSGSVWIFDDNTYDVTEFYTFDEECNSIDVDWKDFKDEIEEEIEEYLDPPSSGGYYGGYDTFLEGLEKSYN